MVTFSVVQPPGGEAFFMPTFTITFLREKTLKGKRKCKHPLTARKSEVKRSVEAVKVFEKKYYLKLAEEWRFFSKPEGLDLY